MLESDWNGDGRGCDVRWVCDIWVICYWDIGKEGGFECKEIGIVWSCCWLLGY